MRITNIETIFADRFLFVRVETDSGLGEPGAWSHLEASAKAVETFKRYLAGKDPLRIEHHSQYMFRSSHFRGRVRRLRNASSGYGNQGITNPQRA